MKKGNEGAFAMCDPMSTAYQIGLTKREYFASTAMQGLLASNMETEHEESMTKEDVIETSIILADLLLEELENTKD